MTGRRARRTAAEHPALEEFVRRIVESAPPLTPAQRARIAVLLAPDLPRADSARGRTDNPDV